MAATGAAAMPRRIVLRVVSMAMDRRSGRAEPSRLWLSGTCPGQPAPAQAVGRLKLLPGQRR
ncbi:hypothetical protein GCM10010271_35530 [Streptomyces kurssanovii]|nr:hypothetical protein GCM10010271_35530 [Streptomyces kurssanovii]